MVEEYTFQTSSKKEEDIMRFVALAEKLNLGHMVEEVDIE